MNAKQREMLAIIDALLAMPDHVSEPPVVREIARWVVCGYSPWPEIENMDGAALEVALMDDLRDLWPEATNEDIRHGLNLAMAGAESGRAR